MSSAACDTVIAYREECTIYEDVCILSAYGTAVKLNSTWTHQKVVALKNSHQVDQILLKAKEKVLHSQNTGMILSNVLCYTNFKRNI